MGCSPSSARYAPDGGGALEQHCDPDATDLQLSAASPLVQRTRSKPTPPAEPKRTGSSGSAHSVDPVSPVDSPESSPERATSAPPGESPTCPGRVRASPSKTPNGASRSGRRRSIPQLRLELGAEAALPEADSAEENDNTEDEEEDYSPEEISHFGKATLGLDPVADADMMWIAEEALRAPLPVGWVELEDPKTGVPYFHSTLDNTVTWEHPLDGHYKLMAARAQLAKPGRKEAAEAQAAEAEAAEADSAATDEDEDAGESDVSPVAARVRATSRDLSTLKQLFTDGLLDESIYQAKQEEVLRNCLSQLAPPTSNDDAEEQEQEAVDGEKAAATAADMWKKKAQGQNSSSDPTPEPAAVPATAATAASAPAVPAAAAAEAPAATPMSTAAAVYAQLYNAGEPPSALWLRLHRKVLEGPNGAALKEELDASAGDVQLVAPRGRDPSKAASAAIFGTQAAQQQAVVEVSA